MKKAIFKICSLSYLSNTHTVYLCICVYIYISTYIPLIYLVPKKGIQVHQTS